MSVSLRVLQQKEMLADPEFGLTHTRLGMFQSAVSIPNLFMPLLGGLLLDHKGQQRSATHRRREAGTLEGEQRTETRTHTKRLTTD